MTIDVLAAGRAVVFTRKAAGLILIFVTAIIWVVTSFISESLVSSTGSGTGPTVPPFLLTWLATTLFTLYLPFIYVRQLLDEWLCHRRGQADSSGSGHHAPPWAEQATGFEEPGEQACRDSDFLLDKPGRGLDADAGPPSPAAAEAQAWNAALWATPLWFLAQYTFNLSLAMTTVTSNTILSSASSLFTFLLSVALLGERFTLRKLACIMACIAGTAMVTLSDVESEDAPAPSGGGGGMRSWGPVPPGRLLLQAAAVLTAATKHAPWGGTSSWAASLAATAPPPPPSPPSPQAATKAPLVGDVLTVVSGAVYAAYTVVMRLKMPGEEAGQQVAHFFGYVGLLTTVALAPVLVILMVAGSIHVSSIPRSAYLIILLEGMLDYVLSDYLWARAVMLVGPTVATLSLSVQIPLAAAVDLLGSSPPTWTRSGGTVALTLLGTACIVVGFVGINLGSSEGGGGGRDGSSDEEEEDAGAGRRHAVS